ncbi:MAG: hypothetical protein ABIH67_05795 [Candidatus Uhrbacteria bacterium]
MTDIGTDVKYEYPGRMHYRVIRRNKRVFAETDDSVAVLIWLADTNEIILISQEREAMRQEDNPEAIITEAVAGRFDVDLSVIDLIIKEAWEEVGARIEFDQITLLNNGQPVASSAGVLTERKYLALAKIRSDQIEQDRIFGAPDEGERITRLQIPISELANMTHDCLATLALVSQFLLHHGTGEE